MEHLPGKMRMAIFYGQERIETVSPSAMVPSQPKSNVEPTDYELSDRHNITRALRQCKGNAVEAAEKLGVSRATIYRKMKKLKMLMRDRLS